MLKLVPLETSLVSATVDEIIAGRERDFSAVSVVSPSARFHHFLRHEISRRLEGPFFPPRLFTVDTFIAHLFAAQFPGLAAAGEIESVYLLWESCRECFGNAVYAAGETGRDYAGFFPRGRQLLGAVEEILTEGGEFSGLNQRSFTVFADLGDYHSSYKEFIKGLPRLTALFLEKLGSARVSTRGRRYREVARLAKEGSLAIPGADLWLFSGFHALNASEREIMHFFFREANCCLLLHTDPASLTDPASPFNLHCETIRQLGLKTPATEGAESVWPKLAGKVFLHSASGMESQMIAIQRLINGWAEEAPECDWRRSAVALPDPSALIPFTQNVVSRFAGDKYGLAWNITLGYPFSRTPMFQLIDAMLHLRENSQEGMIRAADYLALIRHPYVKLSPAAMDGEESLRIGIHLLEEIIAAHNLVCFRPDDMQRLAEASIRGEEKPERIRPGAVMAEIDRLHGTYIIPEALDMGATVAFVQHALQALLQQRSAASHLFFPEYLVTAQQALQELADFCRTHPAGFNQSAFPSLAALIRHFLAGCSIFFEGSPLKGVQVMGMLEFRGLNFDRVAVADAVEGTLPQPRKYDPLLPYDIRRVLRIRSHSDWERLFALHFFSLVASSREIHIFSPKAISGESGEPSRFIERIIYEMEKSGASPSVIADAAVPYLPHRKKEKSVPKDEAVKEKLSRLPLSPSSLETYVRCPLRFYYEKVLGLKERKDLSGEADAGEFGSIVHDTLKILYEKLRDEGKPREFPEKEIAAAVDSGYRQNYYAPDRGLEKVRHWVLMRKLQAFLREDQQRLTQAGIRIRDVEKTIKQRITVDGIRDGVLLEGRVDRIEEQGPLLRVIDYKTCGKFSPSVDRHRRVETRDLWRREKREYLETLQAFSRSCRAFQVLTYLVLVSEANRLEPERLDGAYIFLKENEHFYHSLFAPRRNPIEAGEKRAVLEHFRRNLEETIRDLFIRDAFYANPLDDLYCSFCPFSTLCGTG